MSDLTECPMGGFCQREDIDGHPCDRDEHGDRWAACERRHGIERRLDEMGVEVMVGEKIDPPDHDQWIRQIERVQRETGWKDITE